MLLIVFFVVKLGMFCRNKDIVCIIYWIILIKINSVKLIDKIGLSIGYLIKWSIMVIISIVIYFIVFLIKC